MHFSNTLIAAFAALLTATEAHMKMKTPYPYGPQSLNNSPLQNGMSDFPCKQRPGVYDPPEKENKYSIGEDIELSFTGSAVHGGGSCQISLTSDKKPTKDSKWKVIHSIEGGCPAKASGNMPGGQNDDTTFKFQIPDSIKPGEYTLAWTWLNRIGNREFYMNCAPVTVEGAKKKRYMPLSAQQERRDLVEITKRDDLPEMFVANINGCTTKESVDVRYPDAGKSVDRAGDPQNLMKVGEDVCSPAPNGENVKAGSGSSGGGDSGSSGSGSSGSSSTPTPGASPSPSTPESSPVQTPAAGGSAGGAGADAGAGAGGGAVLAPTPSSGGSETPASSPSPAETPASSPAGGSESSSGSSGGQNGKCDSEGAWNCIGGSSFQRCANGQWSTAQQMPAGVQCTPGQSANLEMKAKAARDEPIARRHAHVHLGHIGH